MDGKTILTCAVTGNITTRTQHPRRPLHGPIHELHPTWSAPVPG